jgi:hypothetical protein
MIVARRGFVSLGNVFLDEESDRLDVDIVTYVHRLHPLDALSWDKTHTLMIDLRKDAEALLAEIAANTRYKIRRAEQRDHIGWECFQTPSPACLEEFCDAFNAFAAQKGQPRVDLRLLSLLAAGGILELSRATTARGLPLAWHSYVCVTGRARLLHSCSLFRSSDDSAFRNLIGRANRLLHWRDMLQFKDKGFVSYDLGGWHRAGTDPELVRINQFKGEFGGTVVPCYSCKRPLTPRGRLVLRLWRLSREWGGMLRPSR